MDFFASQELARRKTRQMVVLLILAVIGLVVAIYLLCLGLFTAMDSRNYVEVGKLTWLRLDVLAIVTLAVLFVVSMGSLYKIVQLRGGGSTVASMLGARRILPNSTDLHERKLLNIVEEMAIASGTPVPPVYILDKEQTINAFAAGYTVDDAVIGVNRGTITQLNRDELQGVVAHEFSHILNGDMRMSIRMIGLLHGIQLIALIGYFILRGMSGTRSSSSDKKGGQIAVLAFGAGLFLIGSIGLFFARLIKASVSRQREYLADASAVQFTRNPDGIGGALKMIGASAEGSTVKAANAEVVSHMYFANMFGHSWSSLLATHPPLVPRIQKIDPRFDGKFAEYARIRKQRLQTAESQTPPPKPAQAQFPGMITGKMRIPGISDRFPLDPAILIAGVGLPDGQDMQYSHQISDEIPPLLSEAIREVFSARCVALAMLLSRDESIRQRQLAVIRQQLGLPTVEETTYLAKQLEGLSPALRLPLFEILQGTLAGMSEAQYRQYRQTLVDLSAIDSQLSLLEFFLQHHLLIHLDRRFGYRPPRKPPPGAQQIATDLGKILSLLARIGHRDADQSRAAFMAAWQQVYPSGTEQIPLDLNEQRDLTEISRALCRLAEATPAQKKKVLSAAAIVITFDQQVTTEEAELFRAVAESLDCPVPPIVARLRQSTLQQSESNP